MFDFIKEAAKQEGCDRIEFTVLKWNKSAQEFYKKIGAKRLVWYLYRLVKEDFNLTAPMAGLFFFEEMCSLHLSALHKQTIALPRNHHRPDPESFLKQFICSNTGSLLLSFLS